MSFYVIIRGPLGCGKSTVAKRLAEALNAEYAPIDRVLDEHGLTKDREAGYISQRSFKKANEIIAPRARKKLKQGIPIVFDGNFYWKSQIKDLISRLDFPHLVFTLRATLETCIERDKNREKTHGEDAVKAVFTKSTSFDYGVVVDVDKPIKECIDKMLLHLPSQ